MTMKGLVSCYFINYGYSHYDYNQRHCDNFKKLESDFPVSGDHYTTIVTRALNYSEPQEKRNRRR